MSGESFSFVDCQTGFSALHSWGGGVVERVCVCLSVSVFVCVCYSVH